MKERGGRLVGEQSIEHIIAWAAANRLTKTTLRNDGFCVHVTVDTERDDPFFALKWISLTYAHYKRQFQLTLLVRTLGMLQRHPLTLRWPLSRLSRSDWCVLFMFTRSVIHLSEAVTSGIPDLQYHFYTKWQNMQKKAESLSAVISSEILKDIIALSCAELPLQSTRLRTPFSSKWESNASAAVLAVISAFRREWCEMGHMAMFPTMWTTQTVLRQQTKWLKMRSLWGNRCLCLTFWASVSCHGLARSREDISWMAKWRWEGLVSKFDLRIRNWHGCHKA